MYSLTVHPSSETVGEGSDTRSYPLQMQLNQRIALARKEAGLTQDQLAEATGKTRSAVVQWESGDVRPRHKTLADIAIATKKDLRWLESGLEIDNMFLLSVGEVAAGTWKEGTVEYKQVPMPVAPSPDFPYHAQRMYRVAGTSLNKVAGDGDYLHAVDIHAAGLQPESGDLVVVRRMEHGMTEYTAKRYLVSGKRKLLVPESRDPQWQDALDIDGTDATEIEITDLVIAVWSPVYRRRGF